MTARDRTGAAALVGAAITGLVAFALILAGGLLLWANGHYKDADGYLSTGSQRFDSREYAITTPSLDVGAGAPGFLLKSDRYGDLRLQTMEKGGKPLFVGIAPTHDVRRLAERNRLQRDLGHRLRAVQGRATRSTKAPARPARPAAPALLGRDRHAQRCTGTSSPATGRSS